MQSGSTEAQDFKMAADRRRNMNRSVESLELTDEERKVLRECRMNSMIRGVPAGIVSAILTSFAVRSGAFPHLAHWSRFYYGVTFTAGLLFGVASYRNTCLEKIMKLENSVLADQVREYYRRSGMEYIGPQGQRKDSEFDESAVTAYNPTDDHEAELSKDNASYSSRLQQDTNTSMDRNKSHETKHKLSFEERRRQHRQRWNMDQYPPLRPSREMEDKSRQSHESDHGVPATSSSDTAQGSIRRNIYGDPIE